MTKYQLTRDAEEIERVMEETANRKPQIYVLAVVIWHILNWIRTQKKDG